MLRAYFQSSMNLTALLRELFSDFLTRLEWGFLLCGIARAKLMRIWRVARSGLA